MEWPQPVPAAVPSRSCWRCGESSGKGVRWCLHARNKWEKALSLRTGHLLSGISLNYVTALILNILDTHSNLLSFRTFFRNRQH